MAHEEPARPAPSSSRRPRRAARRRPCRLTLERLEPREVPSAVGLPDRLPGPPATLDPFAALSDSDPDTHFLNRWIVSVAPGVSGPALAQSFGVQHSEGLNYLPGVWMWEFASGADSKSQWSVLENAKQSGQLQLYYPLIYRPAADYLRFVPDDPLFPSQWHLQNTGQSGGTPGIDVNATAAWDLATGKGVVIAVVDDGVQYTHPDLMDNLWTNPGETLDGRDNDGNGYIDDTKGWNFNFQNNDPLPDTIFPSHGTAVAGVAAADGNNGTGVTGAAFDAQIVPLRLIGGLFSDFEVYQALTYKIDEVHISNNSWGIPDTGFFVDTAGGLLGKAALEIGATQGRGGKGVIYVWAGGNGRLVDDNSNFDGNANSRFAIAVAAVDHAGRFAPYSEPGANLLVTAPSNFFGLPGTGTGPSGSIGITTTDLVGLDGYNDGLPASTMAGFPDYTNDFGGTSSAAPLVSGIIALMLEANPNLTYRDVQHILAVTARKTDPTDLDWTTNAAGYHVNHNYGFGMVDAAAAVNLAKNWQNLPPQSHVSTGLIHVGEGIQDNQPFRGVTRFVEVKEDLSLEWVTLTFNGSHTYRGDLRIVLTSPSGTVSVLATPRLGDPTPGPFSWTFSTARLRGESAKGLWTVTVSDEFLQETGTFDSFQLDFYGVDPALGGVPPKPLPPPPSPPVTGVFQPGEQGSLDPRDNRSGADLAAVTSGPGQSADARGFNVHSGIALFGVKPYGPNFALGIRAAMADVTGDGVADLITVPGPGGGPHVKVFDGVSGAEIASFFAYDPAVRGGLFVAAGDVNGDGRADIVTGADAGGGPHVKVFNGGNFVELQSFMAFDPAFRGGVTVAVGDVDGDGRADVIVGAGAGGGPHVKVFSGATNALIASFMAYDPSFRGGVFVAAGDLNADGLAEVVTGPGLGGGAHVRGFDALRGTEVTGFAAFNQPGYASGARVAVVDSDNNGAPEIVVAPGPGFGARVRAFDAFGNQLSEFLPFEVTYTGGIFVG